jgi:hypothetical protein
VATTGESKYAITSTSGVVARVNEILEDINLRLVQAESRYGATDRAAQEVAAQGIRYLETVIVPAATKVADLLRSLSDLFSTKSTSTVTIGLQAVTFVVKKEDRLTFANLGYVIADADTSDSGLGGPVLSYDSDSGELVLMPDYVWGSGTFSSWTLIGSPPIGAIVAATDPLISARLTAIAQGIVDSANTSIQTITTNANQAVQSITNSAIKTDSDQNLTPAQRAQGKKNLRVEQASFTFTQNTVLTAAHVGAAIGCDPGCTALTLPKLSTVESGAKILMHAYTQSVTVSVDAAETLGIFAKGTANIKSIVIPAQWSLEVVSRGLVWLPRLVPYGYDTPNANVALTFSAAQKRVLKNQIGAGGILGGISAASSLTAAAINTDQFVLGDAYAITLPINTAWVNGDSIRFISVTGGTVTIARNAGDTSAIAYGPGNSQSNISLGPGQTIEIVSDGTNYVATRSGVTPERTLNVDVISNWNATQKSNARASLGLTSTGSVSFRNRIINGNFAINQRGNGNGTYAASAYIFDRWRSGLSGASWSTAVDANSGDVTATIGSGGSVLQIVEGALYMAEGGTYVLSWEGTASARVYAGAVVGVGAAPIFQASPIVFNNWQAGANAVVEFTTGTVGKVQLEPGSVPTPFERRDDENWRCYRYYQQFTNPKLTGIGTSGNTIGHLGMMLLRPMRVVPNFIYGNGSVMQIYDGSGINTISTFASYYLYIDRFEFDITISGATAQYRPQTTLVNGQTFTLGFSAEL